MKRSSRGRWLRSALCAGVLACLAMAGGERRARADGAASSGAAAVREQLLLGVRAFRAEHFDEALQIFRGVESHGRVPEIGFYMGMTLHQLGRHAESLAAFREAQRAGLHEPIADYYQAVSCYRLGMMERARQGFLRLLHAAPGAAPLGPRLLVGTERFLLASAQALGLPNAAAPLPAPTSSARFDAALARLAALSAEQPEALEWFEEAAQLVRQLPEPAPQLARLRDQAQRLVPTGGTSADAHGRGAEVSALLCLATRGCAEVKSGE